MNKSKILVKWTLLVWLNANASFKFSLKEFPQLIDRVGVVCGIITFVIIYTKLDLLLLNLGKFRLRKALLISVIVKSLFQLTIWFLSFDLLAGLLSIGIVEMIIGKIISLSTYLITLTEGFLLSLQVAVITIMINYLMTIFFPTNKCSKSEL